MRDDRSPQNLRSRAEKRGVRPPRRGASPPPLARRSRELAAIVEDLDAAARPRAIHELRTTIRRFEAALAAAPEPPPGSDEVRHRLDRIRKRAGKVRDSDVHLKAVRSLPPALAAVGRDALAAALRQERRQRLERLLRTVDAARAHGLVRRLRRAAAVAAAAPAGGAGAAGQALARIGAGFTTLRERTRPLAAANLHAFRIAVKRLRYRAESCAPHRRALAMAADLERIQDAIGAWHDWATLAVRARTLPGGERAALQAALAARVDSALAAALAVTARVGRRLAAAGAVGARKRVRRAAPPAAAPGAARGGVRTRG